ncbi:hypothetical protein [Nonomuraea composti]|nr:hypothetical protein [Nonomuraea sp. FMUSA5-5]
MEGALGGVGLGRDGLDPVLRVLAGAQEPDGGVDELAAPGLG